MSRYISFFCVFLLANVQAFCQEKWSVAALFDKVEKQYSTEKYYSYSSAYNFYENITSSKIVEGYTGVILKKDNVSYQKINKVELIDFGDYNVMVDHEQKIVQISTIEKNNSPIALKSYLKIFPNKKVTENTIYWICELSTNKITQSPFGKMTVYINKKDFSIYKQVFYMSGKQEYEVNNKKIKLVNPRLEVVFTKKAKDLQDQKRVSRENYFLIKNKKMILSERFKTYKLITN